MNHESIVSDLVASSRRLAGMTPESSQEEAIKRTVDGMKRQVDVIREQMGEAQKGSFVKDTMADDIDALKHQMQVLHHAAERPARNYQKIISIIAGVNRLLDAVSRAENAHLRPRAVQVATKIAGIFAEVDTAEDLDVPLEKIETAVHKLYNNGKLNDPKSYNFSQTGRGHHSKD
jgi:F0F1-type ATP synthase alpha subunit